VEVVTMIPSTRTKITCREETAHFWESFHHVKATRAENVALLALVGSKNVFSSYMAHQLAIFWIESRNPILWVIKAFFTFIFPFYLKRMKKQYKNLNR
jgi:hypothetical protein